MTNNGMSKSLTLKDAPGIALRHMGDPANRQEAEYIFQVTNNLRQTVNLYSFVIENTSGKAIIALSLAYSFPKNTSDTKSGVLRTDAIQSRLLGAANFAFMQSGSKVGLCLALGQENFDFKKGIRYIQPEHPTNPQMTEEQRKQMNDAVLSRFAGFDRLLGACDHWEVEIEGVVFDDGSFVGTNRRHYFEMINAKLAGARSLAMEILSMADKGASYTELVDYAKTYIVDWNELLKPFGGSLPNAAEDESYNFQFSKNSVARRFISLTEAEGMNYLRYGQQNWTSLKKL